MKRPVFVQLLVMFSLFVSLSCGNKQDLNPCNCELNQPFTGQPLTIGKSGSGIVSIAQSFVVSSATTISKVQVYLSNLNDTNALRVTIYGDNGSGTAPDTGTVIGTSVNTTVSTGSSNWQNFCFSADCLTTVALTAGTRYWAVINRPTSNAVSSSTYYTISAATGVNVDGVTRVMNTNAVGIWSSLDQEGTDVSSVSVTMRLGCTSTAVTCE